VTLHYTSTIMISFKQNIETFDKNLSEVKEESIAKHPKQLRPSIFPNCSPFINFIKMTENYGTKAKLEIPWNLWVPCNNPLLLHTMIRAGYVRTEITDVSYSNCIGAIWDSIDSKTRFVMYCKLSKNPMLATKLLSDSGQCKDLLNMNPEVKVNRLPGVMKLCKKNELAKLHVKFMEEFEGEEEFVPETFSLPSERDLAINRLAQASPQDLMDFREVPGKNKENLWIVKPCIKSGGRGIHLIDRIFDIPNHDGMKNVDQDVLQKYISNPLTIRGHKFDIRLYVLITSVDPLVVYILKDGLARFASEEYNTDSCNIDNNCIHLTNSAVNKDNIMDYGSVGQDPYSGYLWTLSRLKQYFETCDDEHIKWDKMWQSIVHVIRKTILMAYPQMKEECKNLKSSYNCYKLLGFDIMLEENLKPWVLEVNTDPCLFADPVDLDLKSALITEMLNIVGFHIPEEVARSKEELLRRLYPDFQQYGHQTRLYERTLQKIDHVDADFDDMLDICQLQGSSLRSIIKLEEELSQCRDFDRIIPSSEERYNKYFPEDCFSDKLLRRWISFKSKNKNALKLLADCCQQNKHLS